jgi:hypothetical protein
VEARAAAAWPRPGRRPSPAACRIVQHVLKATLDTLGPLALQHLGALTPPPPAVAIDRLLGPLLAGLRCRILGRPPLALDPD